MNWYQVSLHVSLLKLVAIRRRYLVLFPNSYMYLARCLLPVYALMSAVLGRAEDLHGAARRHDGGPRRETDAVERDVRDAARREEQDTGGHCRGWYM